MSERDELVQAIMKRPSQPTIEDAVALMKWEKIRNVETLFDLHEKLMVLWVDKRLD